MDSLLNTKKRKKWRTRKHLDEMRKRSRSNKSVHENKNIHSVTNLNETEPNDRKYNIGSVTYTRLTLPIFPKAVRSETITRPVLSQIRHEASLNLNNILGNQKQVKCDIRINEIEQTKDRSEITRHTDHNSIVCENEYTDHVSTIESESENINTCGDNVSSSISLLSNTPQIVHSDNNITETPLNSVSLCTSPSSASSPQIRRYHMYEEFMNGISTYLKENAPLLITDVMKKPRKLLENIYTENCHHEYEENILKHIKNKTSSDKSHSDISPKETIIENPMDYIKLGNAWQSYSTTNLSASSSVGNNSLNSSSYNSPLAPDRLPNLTIVDENTPEYVYYPHKLN